MGSTTPESHWLNWFYEDPSVSHNMAPPQPISPATAFRHGDMTSRDSTLHGNSNVTTVTLDSQPNDILHDTQEEEHSGTIRPPIWRWSTWSARMASRRKSSSSTTATTTTTTTTTTGKRPSSSQLIASTSQSTRILGSSNKWLSQHKRRTYPPSGARRVLKQEHKRLIHGSSRKTRHRLVASNHRSKKQKQADHLLFHHPLRRRHSLSGILSSFVHSATTSLSSSSSPKTGYNTSSNSGSGTTSGGSNNNNSNNDTGLPFFLSQSTSRKSSIPTPTVRSSMILQYADDEDDSKISMYVSEILNQDNDNDGKSSNGTANGSSNGRSISSRKRQKQRDTTSNGWFSNWIMHHPRRKHKHHHHHHHHHRCYYRQWQRQSNPSIVTKYDSSNNGKIHPSSISTAATHHFPSQHLNDTFDDDDDKAQQKRRVQQLKNALPLLRQATLSDLSSLSSSNPSYMMKTASFSHSTTTGGKYDYPPFYPPEKKDHPPTSPSYRFSAFWKSQSGKTGKQLIQVDASGQVGYVTLWSLWDTSSHEESSNLLATLFILGFLLCPFWWLGAILYLKRASCFHHDVQTIHLWTPRTFGHLNCWMSITSLLLIGIIIALVIWLSSTSRIV
ncbi:uncharacterized protein BX664DRAFT_349911 [Halteromyces radiatus]|uniref:uncharacterized protein n=1 Tax=Halteromyces radiatus TaxID=101107 RepID=UPI00221E6490|nr:uncharacterized protein BX664DRAFT_349911 [Halteromyces radiatus]KAI8089525.1 hypothetical protein BX664DRAFT_349911 [Halteromyces radiatus]